MDNELTLRNIGRAYAMYMVVGAAAIPAGLVYATLAVTGRDRWWADLLILAVGLIAGHFAWRLVKRPSGPIHTSSTDEARTLPHLPGFKRG